MSHFTYPVPIVQAVGLVCVPTAEGGDTIERKPVAAAVLTLSQREDGHVAIFHQVATAAEETQFPLPWLVNEELVPGATMLVDPGDAAVLAVDAAAQRFFVEPKIAALQSGATDVAKLAGEWIDEGALQRRLGIPRLVISDDEAARIWTWHPRDAREATLGRHALADATSRLMLWANLMAAREQEPGFFYETMLALREWLHEREQDAPELARFATSKPMMRAASFAEEYRRDLARRLAGEESDWPLFRPGLFHT